jgi:hypothetical protein
MIHINYVADVLSSTYIKFIFALKLIIKCTYLLQQVLRTDVSLFGEAHGMLIFFFSVQWFLLYSNILFPHPLSVGSQRRRNKPLIRSRLRLVQTRPTCWSNHGRTGRKKLGGRKEICPTFSDCARPIPKKLFVEEINFGDPPPPPPPRRQKNFGQCAILGVQKIFRTYKIFRNIKQLFHTSLT